MELTNIKISLIGEEKSGVSKATGASWAMRNVIFSFVDQNNEDNFINARVGSAIWNEAGHLESGNLVSANFRFRTHTLPSGFVSNDITVTSIRKL